MKLVIDSNQLRSPKLRKFLAKSSKNIAVIPDFVAIEAYKGDSPKNIFKSMAVLSEFPSQVLALKSTAKNLGMSGRRKNLQRRLIDEAQTRDFPEYIRRLRHTEAGNLEFQTQILSFSTSANEHIEKIGAIATKMHPAIEYFCKQLTKEEQRILKLREEYTPKLVDKLVRLVMDVSVMIFRDSPNAQKIPKYDELPNTFIFRANLAYSLLGFTRFSNGHFGELSTKTLRNDFVDMMLVAYATFFDGIMSSDKMVNKTFEEVSLLLLALFDAEIPSFSHLK